MSTQNTRTDLMFRITRQGDCLDFLDGAAKERFTLLFGNNIKSNLPSALADEFMQAVSDCLERKAVQFIEYDLSENGVKYFYEARFFPFNDGEVVCLVLEVSEHKKSEQELTKLTAIADNLTLKNSQMEDFTQIVSHNLRSPVGNICALIEHLETITDESDRKDIIHHLKNSSESLLLTMKELNEVLKIKYAGHIETEVIELEKVFEKVKTLLKLQIEEVKADVKADFHGASSILYPSVYIESIFINLLSNAIKYSSPHRKPVIHFESSREHNRVLMKVTDNGLGIDLDRYRHQVFKLRKTFHKHPDSRGVGLFLVKNQIEAMGGEISLISEINVGTTFFINFGANDREQ